MNVWIRRLAWTLGAVVLLLVAVGGYLLATFDPNRYQGLLTDWVKEHKQRTLVIGAPMELKLFPKLSLKLTKVSLSEHQQPAEFLAVDEAELSVDMLALFKRQLVIDRISAEGVRMAYRRDAEGRSNIDDLLKKDEKPPEAGAPSEPLTFDVAAIKLARVSATVDDAKTGLLGSLAINSLSSGHVADGVQSDIQLEAGFDLSKPQLAKGTVKGEFRITPHLGAASPSAELDRIKLTVQGDVPGVKALQAELTGAVAWDGEHQSVKAQSMALEVSGRVPGASPNAPALVVDKGRVAVDAFSYDPAKQLLTLGKLVVAVKAQQADRGMSLDLDWPELDVKGEQLKGSPLKGQLKLTGPIEVAATFASQAPSGGFESIKVPGLKLDFTAAMAGAGGQRQVKGALSTDVTASPRQTAGALEALRLQASIQEPSLQPLQVQVNGRAELAGQTAQWGLKGQLNDNPFSLDGSLKLGAAVPQVQASAHFTSLDLNRLLPMPAAVASAPAGAKAEASSDAPVDLSALKSINGQFKFSADKLAVRQYRLTNAEVAATLNAGHLTLSKLATGAWGGKVLANGSADAGSQRLALQAQAEGINILAMLKDVAGKDMLEGTGQVKLDIKTGGAKVSQLVAGLNGNASLQLRDGAVRGINLAKSLRDFKAQISGKSDAVQKSSQAEKTDFTELTGTFQIKDGVAHNEDLSAKSPFLRVGGRGDINLVERRLNYTVSATVTGTVKGQDGVGAEALNGLTVPVKLSGPFDAPDWKIAWSEVAVGAIQNTIKSKLQEQLNDPVQQQKLKDKLLKGLFK